jgi:single-stranded-DNA-specific exonuclease
VDHAVERIWRALRAGEHIAVWGDFDVDGQTSTTLLVAALRDAAMAAGRQSVGRISYRVPLRDQGHGVYLPAVDELFEQGATLLITCDTGVNAFEAIERAAARGCDVIVTDHHDLPGSLPPALAVVNPKRLPAQHPLRELPGVGVAYQVAERLFEQAGLGEPQVALDLVALGIVADLAIQVGDVRYLLQRGLRVLRKAGRAGLRALVEQAELRLEGLTEEHVGYQLAPRLNALGRLGDANRGVDLLLAQDVALARILAAETDGLNYQRRLITGQILQAALTQIENDPSLLDHRALVVAGRNWHAGILGLVAGRLAEQFQRPAVVLSMPPDGPARGSARSVPGCDIHAALQRTADLLLSFGGHPRAAGLALDSSNVASFRKALSRSVAAVWDAGEAVQGLAVDAYTSLDQLSLELTSELERLAPFGPGNPPIRLATVDVEIVQDSVIGRHGEHRQLVVADERGVQQTVIWWQGADQPLPLGRFDMAYTLRSRDYRGEMHMQVEWIAARPHGPAVISSVGPRREVIDWRREADAGRALARLPIGSACVWMEGEDPKTFERLGGKDRLSLMLSSRLVIWTAPPGPDELAHALDVVNPNVLYLLAVDPATGGFRAFVERLTGMVKHDLRARNGQVDVQRLAANLGHREATVRAGVEWLAALGRVRIVEVSGNTVGLQAGGVVSSDAPRVELRLQRMVDETAAYRRHFRSAPVEALSILL